MIHISSISHTAYQSSQKLYPEANFLQSAEMAQLQADRGRHIEYLAFYQNDHLLGQTIVQYRKQKKFLKEALILHGPLFHQWEHPLLQDCLQALESYLKKQGCFSISISPYLPHTIKDDQLNILQDGLVSHVFETFKEEGYQHYFDTQQETVVNTLFIKPLAPLTSQEELLQSLTPQAKRTIKKSQAMQVKVEELEEKDIAQFYDILVETGKRKGFFVQELDYFKKVKEEFQDQAKLMYAYLDCPAYLDYLHTNIQHFTQVIQEIKEGPCSQGKTAKGKIADASDQLRSYEKRLQQFQELEITTDKLPLSAYLFICYGSEVVSFAGGNYEQYMNFGGATLIHWQMMQTALEEGYSSFNFYGTGETNLADSGKGNFNFKRQFGGELVILPGTFTKPLRLLQRLLSTISNNKNPH